MSPKTERIILLDADVVSHFITGGQFGLLHRIFPLPLRVLDVVVKELQAAAKFKSYIHNALSMGLLKELNFGSDKLVMMEYARLIKQCGKGESATIAYCRYHQHVLASSNLKDIAAYCHTN